MRDQLDSLLDEAARGELSIRDSLTLLCEREIARKDSRRIARNGSHNQRRPSDQVVTNTSRLTC